MRTVIYGLPKSGTTYLFSLLAEAMGRNENLVESFEPRSKDENNRLHRSDGKFWDQSNNMLVKILYADANKKSGWEGDKALTAFNYYDKKIFLVRDPRDRWISAFFYRWFHRHNPNRQDYKRAYELTKSKESDPRSVPFHTLLSTDSNFLKSWSNDYRQNLKTLSDFINVLREKGWFIIRYEDLVDKKWIGLENYLGFSLESKHGIRPSFMHVSRTKTYGNWRRWFTTEDVNFFSPIFNDFLLEQEYNSQDWDLEITNSLPSAEGSDYMKRLYNHGLNIQPTSILKKIKKFIIKYSRHEG
ncbi:MAG: Uncharacterised protein [Owenweeksia sp. TMED14]|mgnify:CR=1 FL=1|nr:MAG: Uncharacterised protein [Owenweeksia sp. TMED14]